jgi:hypothetical protein
MGRLIGQIRSIRSASRIGRVKQAAYKTYLTYRICLQPVSSSINLHTPIRRQVDSSYAVLPIS